MASFFLLASSRDFGISLSLFRLTPAPGNLASRLAPLNHSSTEMRICLLTAPAGRPELPNFVPNRVPRFFILKEISFPHNNIYSQLPTMSLAQRDSPTVSMSSNGEDQLSPLPSIRCENILETLPILVIDGINRHLSLADVKNLRMACPSLGETLALNQEFRRCFAHRNVTLTPQSLRVLNDIACTEHLANFVRSITVTTIDYQAWQMPEDFVLPDRHRIPPPYRWLPELQVEQDKMAADGTDLDMLTSALAKFSRASEINIALWSDRVVPDCYGPMINVKNSSERGSYSPPIQHTVEVVIRAICQSGAQPRKLTLMPNAQPSWAIDVLRLHSVVMNLPRQSLFHSLGSLTSLNVNLADPDMGSRWWFLIEPFSTIIDWTITPEPNSALRGLLSCCADTLEELCLCWGGRTSDEQSIRAFTSISTLSFPRLRRCTIDELGVSGEAMQAFLRSCCRLEVLRMRFLTVYPRQRPRDAWGPIFAIISGPRREVTSLRVLEIGVLRSEGMVTIDRGTGTITTSATFCASALQYGPDPFPSEPFVWGVGE